MISFSIVFQSFLDNGHVIMKIKSFVQWNPIYDCKDFCFKPGLTPGPLDLRPGHNPLSYCGSKSCSNQCRSQLFVEIHVF